MAPTTEECVCVNLGIAWRHLPFTLEIRPDDDVIFLADIQPASFPDQKTYLEIVEVVFARLNIDHHNRYPPVKEWEAVWDKTERVLKVWPKSQ